MADLPNGLSVYRSLSRELASMKFSPPAEWVYDPLDYAWEPFAQYVTRYGAAGKEAIFVGMNPGPFGMVQTGIPFGEIALTRDWLRISAPVGKPKKEHPKRPVLGFEFPRSEVSGARLWGWARTRFGTPEKFFERFFVAQYCPLAFMARSGANVTPDKLKTAEREILEKKCDAALRKFIALAKPRRVIGVGAYARERCELALAGLGIPVGQILHPSPASPAANKGWAAAAEKQLKELGVEF
jgi:single-strand selective monofunctional uracil DNA glycosylase